jgi:hypothetical protein
LSTDTADRHFIFCWNRQKEKSKEISVMMEGSGNAETMDVDSDDSDDALYVAALEGTEKFVAARKVELEEAEKERAQHLKRLAEADGLRRKQDLALDAARADVQLKLEEIQKRYKEKGGIGRMPKELQAEKRKLESTLNGISDGILPAQQEEKQQQEKERKAKEGEGEKASLGRLQKDNAEHFSGYSSVPKGKSKAGAGHGERLPYDDDDDNDDNDEAVDESLLNKRTAEQLERLKTVINHAKSASVSMFW